MEPLVHAMLSNALAATVLAALVAGLGRAYRRPALIHGLWLVVMLKLVTPPFVPVLLPVIGDIVPASTFAAETDGDRAMAPNASAGSRPDLEPLTTEEPQFADIMSGEISPDDADFVVARGSNSGSETLTRAPALQPSILLLLLAGWKWEHVVLFVIFAGALAWWALATLRIISFQRLLRNLHPVSPEWQSRVDEQAERLALDRSPEVYLVPGRVPPMLWAIGGRPRLLVPSALWSVMSTDQRTSLLLHELAHLKRRDHWVRWLELIVGGLYWWHPAVWWIRRSLREAEEQCCDAWVIWAMPHGAKTYATALFTALEFVSGARTAPATASATSGSRHVSSLKRRMRMIVRAKTPKGLSWAGCFAVLGTAALLLPLAPTWAQRSEPHRTSDGLELLDDVNLSELVLDAQDRDQPKSPVETDESVAKALDLGAYLSEIYQDLDQGGGRKDEPKNDKVRDTSEHFEKRVKDLIAKIGSELAPLGEDVSKALEQSVDDLHEALQKENVTVDDLRKSLEKSYEDMRQAFSRRGPVDKDVREAWERSRGELRQEWQKSREAMRQELRDRVESARRRQGELRKDARASRDPEAESDKDNAAKTPERPGQEELENARKEVRELQQQLNRATRRLFELQQRRGSPRNVMPRGPGSPVAKQGPDRDSNDQNLRRERERDTRSRPSPGMARTPETPRQATPPSARRPLVPDRDPAARGRGPAGAGQNPEYDRRFRELDNKLDRLLKELEKLREGSNAKDSKDPSPRSGRP